MLLIQIKLNIVNMVMLWIGIVLGIVMMTALILKYIKTGKYDYVKINLNCIHCGDRTNGLKCPKCEQRKVFKKY